MAIQNEINYKGVTIPEAYIRITSCSFDKRSFKCDFSVYADDLKIDPLYSRACCELPSLSALSEITSGNIFNKAYTAFKNDYFPSAIDV